VTPVTSTAGLPAGGPGGSIRDVATETDAGVSLEELALAARNHAMPLEALRYDRTPVGLHYVLVHYDIPDVDPASFRLRIEGHVERPLELALDDLAARLQIEADVMMECAGNGRALFADRAYSQPWLDGAIGNARWSGTPLAPVLEEAGIRPGAVSVSFVGLDHGLEGGEEQDYERGLTLEQALAPGVLLVTGMNGAPLPPQHGYPLRLLVPGWYGMTSVKWLTRITVRDAPFDGYQNRVGYRWKTNAEDQGAPVERIVVKSLLEPPGFPTFIPRARNLPAGPTVLRGRAWSGTGAIERVEVSTDDSATWTEAELGPEPEPNAWRAWSHAWDATPGVHVVCCRATDASGATQPLVPPWNVGGYANNTVQRTTVTVA
jgi:DMSO/TMAO reductase YedYZ molybdopterin-dependent catalytic subunit